MLARCLSRVISPAIPPVTASLASLLVPRARVLRAIRLTGPACLVCLVSREPSGIPQRVSAYLQGLKISTRISTARVQHTGPGLILVASLPAAEGAALNHIAGSVLPQAQPSGPPLGPPGPGPGPGPPAAPAPCTRPAAPQNFKMSARPPQPSRARRAALPLQASANAVTRGGPLIPCPAPASRVEPK